MSGEKVVTAATLCLLSLCSSYPHSAVSHSMSHYPEATPWLVARKRVAMDTAEGDSGDWPY